MLQAVHAFFDQAKLEGNDKGKADARQLLTAMSDSDDNGIASKWQAAMMDGLDVACRLPTIGAAVQRPAMLLLDDDEAEEGASASGEPKSRLWSMLRPHLPSVNPGQESAGV